MQLLKSRRWLWGVGVAGTLTLALVFNAHSSAPSRQFVRVKHDPVITAWAAATTAAHLRAGRARVWVFFTDKGFYDERGMMAAAAQGAVTLPERAAARRAKMGRDRVMFLDMPVRQEYIDRVADLGGTLRRASRWLNAASFDIDPAQLDSLSRLPFVCEIRPVVGFRGGAETPESEETATTGGERLSGTADILNYGRSYRQNTQINAVAAHTAGHRGQGVRICMLDTGYRKDHTAFAEAYAEGRVIAEWDFINNDGNTQNEGADPVGQHNHGTYCWSAAGGVLDGTLYGPAFEAEFLLGKTEDISSETPVEEDNWVAAVEWADLNGADVISSSLTYSDWYVLANYDGDYCTITKAADSAAVLGILVCNAMGNAGPGASTLGAPADADSILACGAVDSNGVIASFSSRGPTADARIKPEVCAQGVSTWCATATGTNTFGGASGTSLSTPMVAGAVGVILSANPSWTPMQVREAFMATASQGFTPNNTYGWGIVDVVAAINYDGCAEPGAPNAPSTTNSGPCANESYTIAWSPEAGATAYELYENDILIYDGNLTQQTLSRASGSYSYTVKGKNACGAGAASPAGGSTTVYSAPAAPEPPQTSNASPCGAVDYTISWDAVALATAYELYENNVLVYDGPSLSYTANHASGTYDYYVLGKNACATGAASPTGGATAINVCPCHGDPACDGFIDVLDVIAVTDQAFRGLAPVVDPMCTHVSRADVDCDCNVSVTDVVRFVNVAFRNADVGTTFCDPCVAPCP